MQEFTLSAHLIVAIQIKRCKACAHDYRISGLAARNATAGRSLIGVAGMNERNVVRVAALTGCSSEEADRVCSRAAVEKASDCGGSVPRGHGNDGSMESKLVLCVSQDGWAAKLLQNMAQAAVQLDLSEVALLLCVTAMRVQPHPAPWKAAIRGAKILLARKMPLAAAWMLHEVGPRAHCCAMTMPCRLPCTCTDARYATCTCTCLS